MQIREKLVDLRVCILAMLSDVFGLLLLLTVGKLANSWSGHQQAVMCRSRKRISLFILHVCKSNSVILVLRIALGSAKTLVL